MYEKNMKSIKKHINCKNKVSGSAKLSKTETTQFTKIQIALKTRFLSLLCSPVNGVKPPGTNCNKRIFDGF